MLLPKTLGEQCTVKFTSTRRPSEDLARQPWKAVYMGRFVDGSALASASCFKVAWRIVITCIPLWVGLALFSTSLLSHRPLEVSSRVQTMGRGEGGSRSLSVVSGRAFTNVEQPAHPPNASAAHQRNAQRIKTTHQQTTSEEAARKKKGRGSRAEQKKRTEDSRAEAQRKEQRRQEREAEPSRAQQRNRAERKKSKGRGEGKKQSTAKREPSQVHTRRLSWSMDAQDLKVPSYAGGVVFPLCGAACLSWLPRVAWCFGGLVLVILCFGSLSRAVLRVAVAWPKTMCGATRVCFVGKLTLPETNIVPEKMPSQKERSSSNHPFSGAPTKRSGAFCFVQAKDRCSKDSVMKGT